MKLPRCLHNAPLMSFCAICDEVNKAKTPRQKDQHRFEYWVDHYTGKLETIDLYLTKDGKFLWSQGVDDWLRDS